MIEGLGYSGRIIGAAALVMISVFGSFILNDDPTIKQFGLGLATAVAIDAIVVLLFVPALITLAGRATLWFPRWLDRILPRVSIEGEGFFARRAPLRRRRSRSQPLPADSLPQPATVEWLWRLRSRRERLAPTAPRLRGLRCGP